MIREIFEVSSVIVLFFTMNINCLGQADFITIEGHKTEILTAGLENYTEDSPTIVFENGRASKFDSWQKVIDEVSKQSPVFAYNRPRIGKSEDDGVPPTMKYIVENLRKMLLKKGLKPPYLLVGHSFGANYIRSFASFYPDEIAGLIFVDPHDFTKKKGMGRLPYQKIGLSENQIDSIFDSYEQFKKRYLAKMPKHVLEELKVGTVINDSGYIQCTRNPMPDVPVHFIQAGGFKPNENRETPYDQEEMFRINSTLKRNRWLKLLYPLSYGRFFYSTKTRHYVQKDDAELVVSSIKLALNDYQDIMSNERLERKE
jgi:pimeloyl-ACP methyl ester carboxylesterase